MFEGFTAETVDFMWGIRFNNEKAWFEAHKEQYLRSLYEPMKALSRTVYAAVHPGNEDLGLVSKVSRIYRDARRLQGRGPYKDHLWMSLEHPAEEWVAQPVFWFELGPEGYTYGMGYYQAKALTMAKFRARLDAAPKPFEKIVRALNKREDFTLDGTDYKRPKGETTALLAPWYNKRDFSVLRNAENGGELFTPALADRLVEDFKALMPLYRYLITLDGDRDPREE